MKGFTSGCYPKLVSGASKKGFTLIELLVVVLIIGILASVALPKYMLAVRKTRTAVALAFLEKLSDAQSVYFMANGAYPPNMDSLDITPPAVQYYSFSMQDGGFSVRAAPKMGAGYRYYMRMGHILCRITGI